MSIANQIQTPADRPAPARISPVSGTWITPGFATPVQVAPDMVLRDAMYRMNEVFATRAAVVDHRGQLLGWLTRDLLLEHFAADADQALRTPCFALLSSTVAAA